MSLSLNSCENCATSGNFEFKYLGDTPGHEWFLPPAPKLLVCKNARRIEIALHSWADIITIHRADGSIIWSPTKPNLSCNLWTSQEAGPGLPSVSVQQIIANLPSETILLDNKFIDGVQTVTLWFTNALIQHEPVLMDFTVGPYRFHRISWAFMSPNMAGRVYAAHTYEIVK